MDDLNTDGECESPATKSSRVGEGEDSVTSDIRQFPPLLASSGTASTYSAVFAIYCTLGRLRQACVCGESGCEHQLRWLAEVTRAFSFERNLAEFNMSAVTSKFAYIFEEAPECREECRGW